MNEFKKILVGVDLAIGDRFVGKELSSVTSNLIEQAHWLARCNSGELCFVTVLPPRAERLSYDQQVAIPIDDDYKSVRELAEEVLAEQVEKSEGLGIRASCKVIFGKCWVELVREVLRGNYDLVVAGTRSQGPLKNALFGSTGLKLLRKCPCPVWLVKPGFNQEFADILVAHDLSPVGDEALKLGAKIGMGRNSHLHILHVVDMALSMEADQLTIDLARAKIARQLESVPHVASKIKVSVINYSPAEAIQDYIKSHDIHLVVMGTIARTGIPGVIVGNTAEKLLPHLPCSVLAIKPAGFKSPVTLNYDSQMENVEDKSASSV